MAAAGAVGQLKLTTSVLIRGRTPASDQMDHATANAALRIRDRDIDNSPTSGVVRLERVWPFRSNGLRTGFGVDCQNWRTALLQRDQITL